MSPKRLHSALSEPNNEDRKIRAARGTTARSAVHPVLQRCGVGTLLVTALEYRIRSRGHFHAELEYEEHDAGNRAFYEHLGYTAYGTSHAACDQDLPDGRTERYETTCVRMRRDLRSTTKTL